MISCGEVDVNGDGGITVETSLDMVKCGWL